MVGVMPAVKPPEVAELVDAAKTFEEMTARAIAGLEYLYEPGTVRRYSNAGYSILRLALSRAAKRPFADYVRSEILEPLGSPHTLVQSSCPPELAASRRQMRVAG